MCGKKKAESLTVKALDPFSPLVSLPSNIEHAVVETKYWVRVKTHDNRLVVALLWPSYPLLGQSGGGQTAAHIISSKENAL